MKVRLWDNVHNGGWVWFDRKNLRRFQAGWTGEKLWWAVWGFSGTIYLQTWPWQRRG
jgi:hypothetical protein